VSERKRGRERERERRRKGATTLNLTTFSIKSFFTTVSIYGTRHKRPQSNTTTIALSVVLLSVAFYLLLC
jgi:hypothetical protein